MKNKLRFVCLWCLLAGLVALPLAAGSVPAAKPEEVGLSSERLKRIHDAVRRQIDAQNICGAVTIVARRGRVAHFEAQGLMDLESKKPMVKDAVFRLASMTKPITSVAVMMLVEEGKIRLSDPVSAFLPEFKDMKVAMAMEAPAPGRGSREPEIYVIPAKREVTIQDLLTHTSGVVSGGLGARQLPKLAPRGPNDTLAGYIPRLAAVPLDFQPGSEWSYSGTAGPDILGRIVELASGLTYDVYLRQRIFEPLGMKDTSFYPAEDLRPRLVTLYQRTAQGLTKSQNQDGFSTKTYFSGGAGLMSTPEDYLQFGQMLLNGGELNGKRLLSPRTVELMAANHVGNMFDGKLGRPAHGMGFGFLMQVVLDWVQTERGVSTGSFGWDGAYGTLFWVNPREKMVEILMIQTQDQVLQRDFENAVMQAIVE
jgi:CubicO group peptidase (beta-lactamase class C family)